MGSIIIGLVAGFIISLFMGLINFSSIGSLPIVNLPIPFRFGLAFDFATFVPFAIIYLTLTLEVIGDITATSMVTGEPIAGTTFSDDLKVGF